MRSVWYVVWLAWRRVRRRDSGAVVTVLGLAVASALLAGVLGGVAIASDRFTSQEVARIPASVRALRAVWFGVPTGADENYRSLDGQVRRALAGVRLAGPTPLVLFRESTVAGRFVGIAGVEGLSGRVLVRSGRLPRTCAPRRCEVLRLRGAGRLPDAPGLRLVEVGTGTLRSRQLFGDFLEPTDNATADAEVAPALRESGRYHRPAPAPLVVAEGVDALASSPALSLTYRSYGWVWPLASGSPRLWEIDGLRERVGRARAELTTRSGSFALLAPEEELRAAERRADVAGRRLLLVGGEVAALLLAFALLAARGLRRDVQDAHRRLTWYGARQWQLALLTGVESALVAIGGVLAGWVLGGAAAGVAARLAGTPVGAVLVESVASREGIVLAGAVALVTTGVLAVAVSLRPRERARVGVLELVGLLALAVVGIALLGGGVDEDRLAAGEGSAMLLLLLPGLLALVAAIAAARLFRPVARAAAEGSRRWLEVRLAAVGLARGPGAAVATVAFLTIAFAVALLAEGYRATLTRGERDQAAFRVPLDAVVQEDLGTLVRVFDAAPLERYSALAGSEGSAYPILRVTGGAGRTGEVSGVTVLGLDAEAVSNFAVWRPEWAGGMDRGELSRLIDPGHEVALRGVRVPSGKIALPVGPGLVGLVAHVETPAGAFRRVELGEARPRAASVLDARVPQGSLLLALELVPPPRVLERGADAGTAFGGALRLGGTLGRELRPWVGSGGVVARRSANGIELRFRLTPQRTSRLTAPQSTDRTPPRVLVSRALADLAGGVGRLVPVQVGGGLVTVRVGGVVDRFPGAEGALVVGDRSALRTAINAVAPGAARENEVWLDVPEDRERLLEAELERAPFHVLSATTRAGLEEEARRDPLAHGTLFALGAAALLSLGLAAIGLALAVRSDLRDDRAELYELEAQGASPGLLRRIVRSRAAALSAVGLVAGIATGALLLSLVTRVVAVTARGGFAEPPLVATVDVAVVLAGVLVYATLAALLVGVSSRRAFSQARGPVRRGA